ncbi:unnamed protein product [Camellia sinensis]
MQDRNNGVLNLENVKCKLLHWEGTNLVVAEGQIGSRDPKSKVHHVTRVMLESMGEPRNSQHVVLFYS